MSKGIPIKSYIFEGTVETTSTAPLDIEDHWYNMEFAFWLPRNTLWNWVKWFLGCGKKPTFVTGNAGDVMKPQLIFDKMPKEEIE